MRALGPYERLTRPAVLIGAALGLGARDPRCGRGPHQLLAGGLLAHLSAQGADVLWRVTLQPQLRRRKSRDGAIVDFCARLAREVSAVVAAGEFPIVHIGAALGLGARDPRCGRGPHQLLAGGLLAHLSAQGADVLWRVTLQPQLRRRKSRDGAIVDFCARLAREVSAVVAAGEFPIV